MERIYYIPTSSLNFNNIVASESISPANLYSKRAMGMKSFIDIFDGQMLNMTLLADHPACFCRPLSDLEDHPMLIKVILDEENVTTIGHGFYSTNRTIYITPYNTKFIFFNEQDRLITESLSDHSLEVKLSQLYIPQMIVQLFPNEYNFSEIVYPNNVTNTIPPTNDDRINRLKGMLYGYYIGGWMSSHKTDVEQLCILLDVQNVFSASISSGKNKEKELRELSKRWEQLNPLYIELQSVTSNVENVIAVLKKHGVRLPIENLGLSLYTGYLSEPTKEGETNPAMQWIGEIINGHLEKMARTRKTASIDADGILTNGSTLMSITATEAQDVVKHWFNNVLLIEGTPSIASWNRMDLADRITDATSSLLGNEWQNSPQRTFLNNLRHHIGNGEALNVEWNNEALCSIAAVILHGEEWDKMLRFMQKKGMFDYRLAFAMYGALTGYANMTRDLVDTICDETPNGYFEQLYKEIYGQLLGKDLKTSKPKIQIHYSETNVQQAKESIHSQKVVDTKPVNHDSLSHNQVKNQSDEIVEIIKQNAGEKSRMYDKYYDEIISKGLTSWDDIRALKFKGNDGWKGLVDKCRKNQKKENTFHNNSEQRSLFDSYNDKLFYRDNYVWDIIRPCIFDRNRLFKYGLDDNVSREECIKRDLAWFKKMLALPRSERGYQTKSGFKPYLQDVDEKNNKQVITEFCQMRRKELYWNRQIRDEIKQRLLSLYCSND